MTEIPIKTFSKVCLPRIIAVLTTSLKEDENDQMLKTPSQILRQTELFEVFWHQISCASPASQIEQICLLQRPVLDQWFWTPETKGPPGWGASLHLFQKGILYPSYAWGWVCRGVLCDSQFVFTLAPQPGADSELTSRAMLLHVESLFNELKHLCN